MPTHHDGSRVVTPPATSTPVNHISAPGTVRRLSQEATPGLDKTEEQDALQKTLWGLKPQNEAILFYTVMVSSITCEIAAAVTGAYRHTWHPAFIGCMAAFMVLHWGAWLQTAVGMCQRASWVRDEEDLTTRRQFLHLAVRLNSLMLPTAVVALVTFVQAYARRFHFHDLAYWLLFLLCFIWNTVFSVMNAYNNITWESDRLDYEEPEHAFRLSRLAILGIPSNEHTARLMGRGHHVSGKGEEV